eukprot:CAMPEP_0119047842 /NCGR_PEP_ID=MMETSP1177-20130426/55323_1 /TAXON_ID=2985 /ORGANISM="Ochromonas sp, Strain CCMP1899" /LENGTH=86 /DNA_ID=CAMNT_0007022921 /DNA_START=201 /DNA_END=457 /DNA_ORIENTATION=+
MGGGSLIDIKEDTHDGDDLSLEGSSGPLTLSGDKDDAKKGPRGKGKKPNNIGTDPNMGLNNSDEKVKEEDAEDAVAAISRVVYTTA